MNNPMMALGGALVYDELNEQWNWSDGTRADNVRPMRLRQLSPNFRIAHGSVEIPTGWEDRCAHAEARAAIAGLIKSHGIATTTMFDEGWGGSGHTVPVAAWDAVMAPVFGAEWDRADQEAIFARALQLRTSAQARAAGSTTSAARAAASRANGARGGRPRKSSK
jgi:hypothetical protein